MGWLRQREWWTLAPLRTATASPSNQLIQISSPPLLMATHGRSPLEVGNRHQKSALHRRDATTNVCTRVHRHADAASKQVVDERTIEWTLCIREWTAGALSRQLSLIVSRAQGQ